MRVSGRKDQSGREGWVGVAREREREREKQKVMEVKLLFLYGGGGGGGGGCISPIGIIPDR